MAAVIEHVEDLLNICSGAVRAQSKLPPAARELLAKFVGEAAANRASATPPMAQDVDLIERLFALGSAPLGAVIDPTLAARIADHFKSVPCYAAHVAAQSDGIRRPFEETRALAPYGSYLLEDAMMVPDLVALAVSPRILGIADSYLGGPSTLYSMHVFWTFKDKIGGTHTFHRDYDDFRFLSVFIYLTDVEGTSGGVDFIPGSHASPEARAKYIAKLGQVPFDGDDQFDPLDYFPPYVHDPNGDQLENLERVFAQRPVTFKGKAGTGFILDNYGLHRGSISPGRDRLVCWIRYGLTQNGAYISDRTVPVDRSKLPFLEIPSVQVPWTFRLVLK